MASESGVEKSALFFRSLAHFWWPSPCTTYLPGLLVPLLDWAALHSRSKLESLLLPKSFSVLRIFQLLLRIRQDEIHFLCLLPLFLLLSCVFFLLALPGCLAVPWQRNGASLRLLGREKAKREAIIRPGRSWKEAGAGRVH